MEKKTLGSFLAALRKANGMTQKELAEKLAVSDKAVSRWERDECCPDLTLIPVIADIFGVTSDELLRGQRQSPSSPEPESGSQRTKKQLQRILRENETRMQVRSYVSAGVGSLGLLAAMICNLGFLRAYLGFFVACGFYLAGAIMELCFSRLALAAVAGEETASPEVESHKQILGKTSRRVYLLIIFLFVATLPLLTQVGDAYWGLSGGSWLTMALAYCLIGFAVLGLVCWIRNRSRLKQECASQEESVRKHAEALLKLQKWVVVTTAIVLAATFLGHSALNLFTGPETFASGTVFETMEEFRAYAELEEPLYSDNFGESFAIAPVPDVSVENPPEDTFVWYDEFENPISEEDALKRYLFDHGDERYAYIERNPNIAHISSAKGDFPVTVFTYRQIRHGNRILEVINWGFAAAYVVELVAGILVYLAKRKRIS